jgi:hypothetical protein
MKLRKRGTLVVLAALAALVGLLAGCGNSDGGK